LNATVVPPAPLGFLTLWNTGGPQPGVSNAPRIRCEHRRERRLRPRRHRRFHHRDCSNATQLILDINGYFAP